MIAGQLIVISALAILPTSAEARVAPITLKELVDSSDLIVVAYETKVEDRPGELKLGEEDVIRSPIKVATARILEVWKGKTGPDVHYIASPTWTCDISEARVGEQVVLFLSKSEGVPFMLIGHAGRGRMPIRDVEGKAFATIWTHDIRLPKGVMTIPGPETKYEFMRSVELSQLRWTVGAMDRTDILLIGTVGTFALAGLTWFFSSRRHIQPLDSPEQIRALDDTLPRDASLKTWLRPIAKVVFLVATLLALTVLWCNS